MSLTSKISLISCGIVAIGIVLRVHYVQQYERDQLHEGVVRDIKRQEQRKQQNLYLLQQQIELTTELQKLQDSKDEL